MEVLVVVVVVVVVVELYKDSIVWDKYAGSYAIVLILVWSWWNESWHNAENRTYNHASCAIFYIAIYYEFSSCKLQFFILHLLIDD